MWKCGKSAKSAKELLNQTMNVEACKECRMNFKTRLLMWIAFKECSKNFKTRLWKWKHTNSAKNISRPDYECCFMRRIQEEFQNKTMNMEACKDCRKIFKSRLWMWKHAKSAGRGGSRIFPLEVGKWYLWGGGQYIMFISQPIFTMNYGRL